MRVFAYCAQSFVEATRAAAGVEPLTCPPISVKDFTAGKLEGYDLLYFDLHGAPGEPFWFGDNKIYALSAVQVLQNDLRGPPDDPGQGCVVFAANCYLADEDSPMMEALLDAGAQYVIGGDGKNWGPKRGWLYGAPLLGLWLRRWMRIGLSPLRALGLAKKSVRLRGIAAADTVKFRAYYREV